MADCEGTEKCCVKQLRKYSGSHELRTLQAKLIDLAKGILPECMNFAIKTCNVLKPVSFSKADVVLKPFVDLIYRPSASLSQSSSAPVLLYFDQIFDTGTLENIWSNDLDSLDAIQNESMAQPLLVVLDFLRDIEKHQEAIYKVTATGGDEAGIRAVLAHHLFSQLTPDHNYVVDERCQSLSCPCECKAKILKGCTAIGSSRTWHGYADIMLNNVVAVSLLGQSVNKEDCEEPPAKKLCKEDKNLIHMCVEVKNVKSDSEILLKMWTVDQMIAECITNGFAQVNMNASLSGWLIPTFGCTAEAVCIFLYDSDNDILLQTCRPLDLWDSEGILSIRAVTKLWLFLNFPVFFAKNISKKFDLVKSNFHKCAECSLKYYNQVQCKQNVFHYDCCYEKLYEPAVNAGRRACLRIKSKTEVPDKP